MGNNGSQCLDFEEEQWDQRRMRSRSLESVMCCTWGKMRLQPILSFNTVASFFLTFRDEDLLNTLCYCTYCIWQFHITRHVTTEQKKWLRHERCICPVCPRLDKSIQAIFYPSVQTGGALFVMSWSDPNNLVFVLFGFCSASFFPHSFDLYHKMTHFKKHREKLSQAQIL